MNMPIPRNGNPKRRRGVGRSLCSAFIATTMSVVLALSSVGGGALSAFAATISNDSASQQGAEANAVPGHLVAVVSVGAQIYQQREAEEAARAAAEEQARQEAAARAAAQAQARAEAEQAAAQAAAEMERAATQTEISASDVAQPGDVAQVPSAVTPSAGEDALEADDSGDAPMSGPQSVTDSELADHVVPGLNPENTTVNLFDYDTDVRVTNPSVNTYGSDTLGTTGGATAEVNYDTWLNKPDSINYGHLLTFGDGMRHLGYWNQGIVSGYGEIALDRPGMQGIVSP